MSSPSASAAAVKPDDDANSSGSGEMRPRAVNVWPAIDGERKDAADTKKASRRSPSESRDDDKSDEGDRHRSRHHRDGDRSRRYHDKHRSPRRHDRDRSPRRHDRDRSRSPKRHHDRRRSSYDRRRRDDHEDRYDSDRRHNRSDRRHDDRPHRRSSDHDRHRDRDHRDRRDSRGHDRKDDRDDDKERDEKRHHRDEQRDSGMSQHAQDKELDQSPSLQQRPDTTADQRDDVKKIDAEKPETNSAGPVAAETGIEKKPALRLKMKLKNQPEKRKVSKLEEQAMEILAAEKKGLQGAGTSSAGAIEVVLNDRLGTKTRVKCLKTDTVGQLKQLIAVQVGVRPEKIRLQKWYTVFKDHITLDAYEVLDGMSLELYYN